jgi:hydroxypyruvate reductase
VSRELLLSLFEAAVAAADPTKLLGGRLPAPHGGRTLVVGAGKAAAGMALAVDREWEGRLEGLVITPYGPAATCERITLVEAAHPLPDVAGRDAAARILRLAAGLEAGDLMLCLVSGGGSALLELPAEGLALEDIRAVTAALLRSGATIAEMNCVRKHLSAVKGGRLAQAARPARVVTYLISDVPGDDPAVIASGPTVPDPTTFAEALAILRRYDLDAPPSVTRFLQAGSRKRNDAPPETPKPGDPSFAADEVVVLATARDALEAAALHARAAGFDPMILGDDLEGEARDLAAAHAALATACARGHEQSLLGLREAVARGAAHLTGPLARVQRPLVLLSGGETTVTVRGQGRGGRNGEYLLALALTLDGHPGISAIACDTDGVDGFGDAAGAIVTTDTLARARRVGLDPVAALAENDSHSFFAALGDLVVTGPTGTNVNDFRAILVE